MCLLTFEERDEERDDGRTDVRTFWLPASQPTVSYSFVRTYLRIGIRKQTHLSLVLAFAFCLALCEKELFSHSSWLYMYIAGCMQQQQDPLDVVHGGVRGGDEIKRTLGGSDLQLKKCIAICNKEFKICKAESGGNGGDGGDGGIGGGGGGGGGGVTCGDTLQECVQDCSDN